MNNSNIMCCVCVYIYINTVILEIKELIEHLVYFICGGC